MEKEQELDSRCILSPGHKLRTRGRKRNEIEPPCALNPNGDEPGEDVTPFLPRFLLQ